VPLDAETVAGRDQGRRTGEFADASETRSEDRAAHVNSSTGAAMYTPAIQRQLIEAHQQDLRRLMTGQQAHARWVRRSTRCDRRRGVIRLRLIARSA
jgi:hypothetical protein